MDVSTLINCLLQHLGESISLVHNSENDHGQYLNDSNAHSSFSYIPGLNSEH